VRPLLIVLALSLLAPAAARASQSKARIADRIVAVVNEDIILETELDQWAVPQMRGPVDLSTAEGKKTYDEVRHKALDQLIDQKLIEQQATELKLGVSPEEIQRGIDEIKTQYKLDDAGFVEALKQQGFTLESYRKNMRSQILQLKVISTAVRSRVSVSDDEVKAFYRSNARQMATEGKAHLRQILVAVPSDATAAQVEEKRQMAAKVVELARAGKSFAELAKSYSDDSLTKEQGGDLGWVGNNVLVDALAQAVAGMDPGDVRGPIRTERGWHVVQLVERQAGGLKPLAEVKDQIRKELYDQEVQKATQSWLRELRKKAHIDVRL
jgi:peptidyl-prolyl cis-trans isomerase SurA